MRSYRHGRPGGRRWGRLVLFFGMLVIILGIAGYLGFRNIYERGLLPVDRHAQESIVYTLESGASVPQIAQGLAEKGLIRSSSVFSQYVRNHNLGELLQAGTYSLKKSYDVPTIVDYFINGKVDVNLFTILPGRTIAHVRAALLESGFSTAEVDGALNPASYAGHPALVDKPEGASLEGYLYPDSYYMVPGETPAKEVIGLALDEMANSLTPEVRAGISARGLGIYQGITLASIVEKEAGSNDEKPIIARVFMNRLARGMRLQSDPTAVYGAVRDGVELPEQGAISAAIAYASAYNTYTIDGLMPGPISNVSSSSLQAIASPGDGDFLYFVAGADCVTRFSKSIDEHETLISRHGLSTTSDLCR